MNRRELLVRSMGIGAVLILERIGEEECAADINPRLFIHEGTMSSPSLGSWPLCIGVNGSRARGMTYDPSTVGTTLSGYRLDGRFRFPNLTMDVYDGADYQKMTKIGYFGGMLSGGALGGTFNVERPGGAVSGSFSAPNSPVSPQLTISLIGRYLGRACDPEGNELYTGLLSFKGGSKFQIRKIHDGMGDPTGVRRVSGSYSVTQAGDLWAMPTPAPLDEAEERCGLFDCMCRAMMKFRYSYNSKSMTLSGDHPFRPERGDALRW